MAKMRTIQINATEHDNACEAMQWADAEGGKPVTIAGRYFTMSEDEVNRITAMGISFAVLGEVTTRGGEHRIATIPIN